MKHGMTFLRRTALALALFALAAIPGAIAAPAGAPTGEEILGRMDANAAFGTIRYIGTMEITIGGAVRTKAMRAQAMGTTKAFVEFTDPEDRGVRYLKLDKNLWMYFADQQETVKISGHLLKEGMMGSDVSYEDALESHRLLDNYAITLAGEDEVDGRKCWVVELVAKAKAAPYERQKLMVDEERFVSLAAEMYARSGKLLKTTKALEIRRIGDRWFTTKVEMVNRLRRDTKTVFTMSDVELEPKLDPGQFTLRALER